MMDPPQENKKSPRITFVCVENAGRSQMATAFAEKEAQKRNVNVQIITGGTRPAEHVHDVVIKVMREKNILIGDRQPRKITPTDLKECDYTITMGCSAEDVCPAGWRGENRDWQLADPKDKPVEAVRRIRDKIEDKVRALFDEIETE